MQSAFLLLALSGQTNIIRNNAISPAHHKEGATELAAEVEMLLQSTGDVTWLHHRLCVIREPRISGDAD